MTRSDPIAEIEKRVEAAFDGPWVCCEKHEFGYWNVRQDPKNWDGMGYQHICCLPTAGRKGSHYGDKFKGSAEFIAHARSDIPFLLQALAASQARVKELESGATVSLHQAWGYAKEHPSECAQGYDKEAFSHVQFWMERAAQKGTP